MDTRRLIFLGLLGNRHQQICSTIGFRPGASLGRQRRRRLTDCWTHLPFARDTTGENIVYAPTVSQDPDFVFELRQGAALFGIEELKWCCRIFGARRGVLDRWVAPMPLWYPMSCPNIPRLAFWINEDLPTSKLRREARLPMCFWSRDQQDSPRKRDTFLSDSAEPA